MYRLPNQFDLAGRQDDLSAAGGGSTSTTCSSCLVTVGMASVATASIFSSLVPQTLAANAATDTSAMDTSKASATDTSNALLTDTPNTSATAALNTSATDASNTSATDQPAFSADHADESIRASVAKASVLTAMPKDRQPSRAKPSADVRPPMSQAQRRTLGAVSIILAVLAGIVGGLIHPLFGAIAFCAVYIGICCVVYERSNRSPGVGAAVAIGMLIAIVACAAFEMYIWIENM